MIHTGKEIADLREHLERFRGVTLQTPEWVPEERLSWGSGTWSSMRCITRGS